MVYWLICFRLLKIFQNHGFFTSVDLNFSSARIAIKVNNMMFLSLETYLSCLLILILLLYILHCSVKMIVNMLWTNEVHGCELLLLLLIIIAWMKWNEVLYHYAIFWISAHLVVVHLGLLTIQYNTSGLLCILLSVFKLTFIHSFWDV